MKPLHIALAAVGAFTLWRLMQYASLGVEAQHTQEHNAKLTPDNPWTSNYDETDRLARRYPLA